MKPLKGKVDWGVIIPMIVLVILGFIMIMSSSAAFAKQYYGDSFFFMKRHFVYTLIGAGAFILGMRTPHALYKQYFFYGFALSLVLLVMVFLPVVGVRIAGANRWLNLGFMNIQPVEVAKFFVIVFVGMALENKDDKMKNFFQGMVPILAVVGLPVLLVLLQPDLGSALIILSTTFTLFFLSKVPLKQLVSLGVVGVIGIIGNILLHPYQMERVRGFLSPWDDPMGRNYHMIQSMIAIGSGGTWGLGLGESKLKYFYLPLQYADFIYSVVCEEGGFILGVIVIVLFGLLAIKGMRAALQAKTLYGYYLGCGVTCVVTYQAIINMGVVIGVLPVTGIPLTFISFGGTSLVTSMFYIGVLANVSMDTQEDDEDDSKRDEIPIRENLKIQPDKAAIIASEFGLHNDRKRS